MTHRIAYVECCGPLPPAEELARVASTAAATFALVELEPGAEGRSWRSVVLARVGQPDQRIEIRPVAEDPLILEVRHAHEGECGPLEFHLAMETRGRTRDRSEVQSFLDPAAPTGAQEAPPSR